MFLATMLVLALDILWEPVINYITHGKYGDSNSLTFYILSLCVPMQFFINFLWSLSFAGKKYRLISKLIIFSAVINIVLLVILIPLFQAPGAAISFVITSIIQSVGYYYIVKREFFAISLKNAISFFLIGFIVFLICRFIDLNVFYKLLISIVSYIVACICFRQIRKVHAVTIFELFRK